MPPMSTLETCFKNNPDGAGFMYAKAGLVTGHKGYFKFEELKRSLMKLEAREGSLDALAMVFHFRIATHGGVRKDNCHPFPVCGTYSGMRKLHFSCRNAFAHNGIIKSVLADGDIKNNHVSDTMVFGKKVIFGLLRSNGGKFDDEKTSAVLRKKAGSKLAFLNGDGVIKTIGDFNTQDGVLYSNYSYSYVRTTYAYCTAPAVYTYPSGCDRTSEIYKNCAYDPKVFVYPKKRAYYIDDTGDVRNLIPSMYGINGEKDLWQFDLTRHWEKILHNVSVFDEDGDRLYARTEQIHNAA